MAPAPIVQTAASSANETGDFLLIFVNIPRLILPVAQAASLLELDFGQGDSITIAETTETY